jgi:hypothetical protein
MRNTLVAGFAILVCLACSSEEETTRMQQDVEALERRVARLEAAAAASAAATSEPTPSPTAVTADALSRPQPQLGITRKAPVEVVSLAFRTTETTPQGTLFEWQLTARNTTPRPQAFGVKIEWQDGRGSTLDSDESRNLSIGGGAQQTFTGEDVIENPVASRIRKSVARIE